MGSSFSYEQHFCHSKVFAIATWVPLSIDEDSATSSSVGSGFTCFTFSRKSSDGLKGHLSVFRNSGPFNQLLCRRASPDKPLVRSSAGLSADWTWYHSPAVVSSSISATWFASNTGCFSRECSYWRTVVLPVHMNVLSICKVSARCTSFLNLAASNAACSSSLWMVDAFIGATSALPNSKAISVKQPLPVLTLPLRKATALKHLANCHQTYVTPNIRHFVGSNFLEPRVLNSELLSRNLVTMPSGRWSSPFWPLSLHMSFSRSRAFTVYGATSSIGS